VSFVSASCIEGETKCDGTNGLAICNDKGRFILTKICDYGCEDNSCIEVGGSTVKPRIKYPSEQWLPTKSEAILIEKSTTPIHMLIFISPQYASDNEIRTAIDKYADAVKSDIDWNSLVINLKDKTNTPARIREAIRTYYSKNPIKAAVMVGEDIRTVLKAEVNNEDAPSIELWSELNENIRYVVYDEYNKIIQAGITEFTEDSTVEEIDEIIGGKSQVSTHSPFTPEVAVSLIYPSTSLSYNQRKNKIINVFDKFSKNRNIDYTNNILVFDYNLATSATEPDFMFHRSDIEGLSELGNLNRDHNCEINSDSNSCNFHLEDNYMFYGVYGHGTPMIVQVSNKNIQAFKYEDMLNLKSPIFVAKGCHVDSSLLNEASNNKRYDPPENENTFSQGIFENPNLRVFIGGTTFVQGQETFEVLYKKLNEGATLAEAYTSTKLSIGGNTIMGDPTFHYKRTQELPPPEDECIIDSDCDDNDASTKDTCIKTSKICANEKIIDCVTGDNYCPPNCNYQNDKDCLEPDQCSADSDCDDANACTTDRCTGKPKKCSNERISEGCNLNDDCVPIGTKTKTQFCDIDYSFKNQKPEDTSCSTNYECSTNKCVNNKCISPSFIQKIIDWFKNIFG